MSRRPPRSTRTDTLFPYTTLFRSLYASRDSDVPAFSQMERARAVFADYDDFTARSRALQLQFKAALFLGSLLLVGLTVWIALAVSDRLVRLVVQRSEERRVGKECGSMGRYRRSQKQYKK